MDWSTVTVGLMPLATVVGMAAPAFFRHRSHCRSLTQAEKFYDKLHSRGIEDPEKTVVDLMRSVRAADPHHRERPYRQ